MDSQEVKALVLLSAKAATEAFAHFDRQYAAQCRAALSGLQDQIDAAARAVAPILREIAKTQDWLAPRLAEIARAAAALPQKQRDALDRLARDGWYPHSELLMSEIFDVADLLEEGKIEEARTRMCNHFDSELQTLEGQLSVKHSDRLRVLRPALEAHRVGQYALSIPVFLAQADGICAQSCGTELYARRNGSPKLAAALDLQGLTPFERSLFHPLLEPMPISASAKERDLTTENLHRHAILHGEAFDYDTRVNSARALSLLLYVAWVFDILADERPESSESTSA